MKNFISTFADALNGEQCGLTIDIHRGNKTEVVQYLWATPSSLLSRQQISELTEHVNSAADLAGFVPGETEPYKTTLPNEVAVLDSCPFQPEACAGKHLVISGSGKTNNFS